MRRAAYTAVAAAVLLTAAAFAAAPNTVRRIQFPAKSLGKLEFVDRGGYYMADGGQAAGSREIPPEGLAVLRLREYVVTKKENWSQIPKDIDGLDFRDLEVDDNSVAGLVSQFPNIKYLCVTGADVTDAVFAKLPKLPQLENLSAGRIAITGAALKNLTKFPNLRFIILHDTMTGDEDCASLLACPKLFEVQLQHTHVSDKGLAYLGKLPKLRVLNVSRNKITAQGLQQMTTARGTLEWIAAYMTDIGDDGLAALAKFPKLNTIIIRGAKKPTCTAKGIAALAPLKALQHLDMNDSDVRDDVLKAIPAALPNLIKLSIAQCPNITDAGCTELGRMKKITDVRAPNTPLGDGFMKVATNWKQISMLQCGSNVTDAGVKTLADAKSSVKSLLLENAKLSDKGVSYLGALTELRVLALSNNNITDACIPALSKLKKLEGLALQNTKISEDGVGRLRSALPSTRIRY